MLAMGRDFKSEMLATYGKKNSQCLACAIHFNTAPRFAGSLVSALVAKTPLGVRSTRTSHVVKFVRLAFQ